MKGQTANKSRSNSEPRSPPPPLPPDDDALDEPLEIVFAEEVAGEQVEDEQKPSPDTLTQPSDTSQKEFEI